MKSNDGTIGQIIFQSARAMVTIIMFLGIGALLVNGGTGVFEQSIENIQNARDLLENMGS